MCLEINDEILCCTSFHERPDWSWKLHVFYHCDFDAFVATVDFWGVFPVSHHVDVMIRLHSSFVLYVSSESAFCHAKKLRADGRE